MSTAIKQLSVKQMDGTYLDNPIGADANNIDIDENTTLADKASAWDTKLEGIENGAQVNDIETVSVNGMPQSIINKNVDITVPDSSTLAPTNHATTNTIYGAASDTNYGHARVVNAIESRVIDPAAAASAQSVFDGIKEVENKIPSVKIISTKPMVSSSFKWTQKTWNGFSDIYGKYIWTDGENIYYSQGSTQYVLDKSTSTWTAKTWNGLTSFNGNYIWSDGENIYFSNGSTHYVLDKSTSTWTVKPFPVFNGNNIWTDGENIYCSSGSDQYILDKSTSTWSAKTWNGYSNISGNDVWTDGEDIYYSSYDAHYVLDKSTDTWNTKTWNGITYYFYGEYIWTDGENIYYSETQMQGKEGTRKLNYVLNKSTSTWTEKTWNGYSSLDGNYVWTDGENVYYSTGYNNYTTSYNNYILNKSFTTKVH